MDPISLDKGSKMPSIKPPENFNFSKPVEWPAWKQRFLRYRTASKLTDDDGAVQVSTLIYSMGPESERIFQSFAVPPATEAIPDPSNHFDTILKLFDTHFVPKRNVIHERAKFYTRSQSQSETIEQYVRCMNWQNILTLKTKMNLSVTDLFWE